MGKMKVTVVDSVKGGCGKTSISLKYAAECAEKGEKVCVVDMDLLGSSMETFIAGKKFGEPTPENGESDGITDTSGAADKNGGSAGTKTESVNAKISDSGVYFQIREPHARHYINDMFHDISFDRSFLTEITIMRGETPITNSKDKDAKFFLTVCSPNQNEKNRFKPSREIHYIQQIDYGYFAAQIEKMFEALEEDEYDRVIIDMPPNSDAYTDMIFSMLLKADSGGNGKTKYDVEIFIVNSFDYAHFKANTEWLKSEIENCEMKQIRLDDASLYLVFNDTANYCGGDYNEKVKKAEERYAEIKSPLIKIQNVYLYVYDELNVKYSINNSGISFKHYKYEKLYKDDGIYMRDFSGAKE